MKELFLQYLNILYPLFQYDVDVLSQKWMIFTVIPAGLYLVFFFIKWAVLTTPLWLPISLALSGLSVFKHRR